jgi:DnaJ-class molecular chaperone
MDKLYKRVTCEECKGTGRIFRGKHLSDSRINICPVCHGEGFRYVEVGCGSCRRIKTCDIFKHFGSDDFGCAIWEAKG